MSTAPKAPHPRDAALATVQRLRAAGFAAVFAGGCVRDELLGREPDDYDVVTNATPDQIAPLFQGRTSHVGAHFGVVIVRQGGWMVEVATFRTDGSYSDRRRPDSIHFSTPQQDALRRDFTVNALFLDPLGPSNQPGVSGDVIDYVGGVADLHARLIRAVGDPDQRLAEDDLRALRAVRLAAKLGFSIDPGTSEAITRHAASLAGISRERIGDEVCRMMAHPSRATAATLMRSLGLDASALALDEFSCLPASPDFETLRKLSPQSHQDSGLAAYALDLGASPTAEGGIRVAAAWRTALCISNEEQASLKYMLGHVHLMETSFTSLTVAQQKRTAAKWRFSEAVELVTIRDAERGERLRRVLDELDQHAGGITPPQLLTGDDLVAMGMPPGPMFKRVLDAVYDAQLEGRITTPEDAASLARQLMKP